MKFFEGHKEHIPVSYLSLLPTCYICENVLSRKLTQILIFFSSVLSTLHHARKERRREREKIKDWQICLVYVNKTTTLTNDPCESSAFVSKRPGA